MKKSFLYTFVVLSVFAIFVFGNVEKIYAQTGLYPTIGDTRVLPPVEQANLSATTSSWLRNGIANVINWTPAGLISNNVFGANLGAAATQPSTVKGFFDCAINPISCAIGTGSAFYLQLITLVLRLSGGLFDTIINYTIVDPSLFAGIESSILAAWKIVRDIANIVIVFSLLYLGIKTILNGNGFAETKVLISIIIAAILINFSLIITQTVFNVSNLIGAQIGEQIQFSGAATGSQGSGSLLVAGKKNGIDSISEGLVGMIRPDNLMGFLLSAGQDGWQQLWNKVQIALFTGTAMFMLIIIFLGSSILLMYRFLVFIVLMITSPIGITSSFVPWFSKIGEKWWAALKSQAIVLPAFLLTLYISILFVAPLSLKLDGRGLNSVNVTQVTGSITEQAASGLITFVFHYLLIIGFLLLPLIVPGKIGAAGSDMMTGAADWTTKKIRSLPKRTAQRSAQFAAGSSARAGRAVLGGVAGGWLKDSKRLKTMAQSDNAFKRFVGQTAIKTGSGLQNKTYDIRNIDAIGKSDFGKGMGKGIEGWTKAIKTKKDSLEKRKKEEMKMFGFDKMHETEENKLSLIAAEKRRDGDMIRLDDRKRRLEDAKTRGASQDDLKMLLRAVDQAEKRLTEKELLVGQLKNRGDFEYTKQLERRLSGGGSPKITTKGGFYEMTDESLKKWKTDGQSKSKKKKKREDEWIENGGTPPPTPATPPAPVTPPNPGP